MPLPALLIPLIFWTGIAAFSSWAVSRVLPMTATHSEDIDAPVDKVWKLITDPDRAAQWNPHVLWVKTPHGLAEGRKFRMKTRHPETKRLIAKFRPTITALNKNQEFTWSTNIVARWILNVTSTITLEALDDQHTRITQTMNFKGALSPGVPFLTSIAKIQEASNLQLKELIQESPTI